MRSGTSPDRASQPGLVDPSAVRGPCHHLDMTSALPRTVRAVDTAQLLDLEQEAAICGFSQRLPVNWIQEHLAVAATHYLFPTLVHPLRHRPQVSPQWRCLLLLTVSTGEQIKSLLDVLPDTFDKIPETLNVASRMDIISRTEHAVTVREEAERMAADPGPGEMPRT